MALTDVYLYVFGVEKHHRQMEALPKTNHRPIPPAAFVEETNER